jgi:hypothetical protein
MSDIRFSGVAVYPHVVQNDAAWGQQCNLPVDICRGHVDDAIAEAVQIILALTPAELVEFARQMAAANGAQADAVADALLDAVYDAVAVQTPVSMSRMETCQILTV